MIIFDTETTGLYGNTLLPLKQQPKIIELFALKLDDKTLEETASLGLLIHPGDKLSKEIIQITGITDELLEGKPSWPMVQKEVAEFFLGERRMVAHNLSFDAQLLNFELRRTDSLTKFPWPMEWVDTVEATEHLKGFRLSLSDLHIHLFGEAFASAHRAENDVRALARCYVELVNKGLIS